MFEQYANALHQKYPELQIEGDNYPPTAIKFYLAQALSFLKLFLIMCVVTSNNPFNWVGMETPQLFTYALENKVSPLSSALFISASFSVL